MDCINCLNHNLGSFSEIAFLGKESYAGMFIPSVAQRIMEENNLRKAAGASKDWLIPLGGASL